MRARVFRLFPGFFLEKRTNTGCYGILRNEMGRAFSILCR